MASIPLKTIVDLHARSVDNPGRWVKGGREYEAYTYPDGRFKLTHYGTVIFSIDPSTRQYKLGGYSASDRAAVETMMRVYRINGKPTNAGRTISVKGTGATGGSYNRRSGTAPARGSRNAPSRSATAAQELARLGYDLVREDVVGRDREMGYVESVVIGKRRSDGRHAVWYGIDWTRHPVAGDRSRGYTLQQGSYDLTRAGADREAADRLRRSTRYGWEKVPSGNAKGKSGKYNGSPRPEPSEYEDAPYARRSVGGHTILKVYYDRGESKFMGRPVYDVVARRDDTPGLIWGRDYDPNSGLWNGGDYDQTVKKVETHAMGHELIASYNFIGDAMRRRKNGSGGAKGGSAPKPKGKPKTTKPKSSAKSGGKATASRSTRPRTTKSGSTKPGSPAKRRTTAGRSGGARR